jgi:hypothetical protein
VRPQASVAAVELLDGLLAVDVLDAFPEVVEEADRVEVLHGMPGSARRVDPKFRPVKGTRVSKISL